MKGKHSSPSDSFYINTNQKAQRKIRQKKQKPQEERYKQWVHLDSTLIQVMK